MSSVSYAQVNPFTKPAKTGEYIPATSSYPIEKEARVLKKLMKKRQNNAKKLNKLAESINKVIAEVDEKRLDRQLTSLSDRLNKIRANNNLTNIEDELNTILSNFQHYVREYQERVERKNENVNIINNLRSKFKNGDFKGALDLYSKLIDKNPRNLNFRLKKARLHRKLGEFENAISEYEYVIRNSSDDKLEKRAKINKGWALIDKQEYKSAIVIFQKSLGRGSETYKTNSLLGLGSAYAGLDQYKTSNRKIRKVLKEHPNQSMAYNNLGWNFYEKGNPKKALKYINKALKSDVENEVAWGSKCEILLSKKEYKRAIKSCDRALEIDKFMKNALLNRAKAKLKINETEKACKDLSRAGDLGLFKAYQIYDKKCLD
jgi:tetratricopeptide (TPR) repeat protein